MSTRWKRGDIALVGLALALLGTAPTALAGEPAPADAPVQEATPAEATERGAAQDEPRSVPIAATSVSLSSDPGGRAALELRLAEDGLHEIVLEDGVVRVDGRRVVGYEVGGAFEAAWRELLRSLAGRRAAEVGRRLLTWEPGLSGTEAEAATELRERLDGILAPPSVPETEAAAAETPRAGPVSIAPGGLSFEALTSRLERLHGSLEALGEQAAATTEELALIVHDDYAVEEGRTVAGNLALLDGRLDLAGAVRGDVLVLDGVLALRPSGRIDGDLLQVGGRVEQEGGRLAGELLSIRDVGRGAAAEAREHAAEARERVEEARDRAREARAIAREHRPSRDRGFFDRTFHNIEHAIEGLASTLSAFLGLGVLGLLAVYFARPRLERVADTARRDFGRSFGVGLAAEVLFIPAFVILCVAVITIPLALLLIPLTAAAVLGGYLAVSHSLGEVFAARRYRYEWLERLRRSNSYYYVLTGLGLLLLPFAVAALLWLFGGLADFLRGLTIFAAVVVTWLATTTGLGAVVLTRGGEPGEPGMPWRRGPSPAEAGGPETETGGAGA